MEISIKHSFFALLVVFAFVLVVHAQGDQSGSKTTAALLNEKSDVYSFGVVLLQIITGQPAIIGTQNIKDWVRIMLVNGDITSIVDPKLQGDFDVNSVWNALDIARACVSQASAQRQDMSRVVTELKNCLAEELARRNHTRTTDPNSEVFSRNDTTEASSLTTYHSAC